jgi:uncharacterized protein (TIGR02266 family)
VRYHAWLVTMGHAEPASRQDAEAFERLRGRLTQNATESPPHINPRALAVNALLAADRLGQPDARRTVDGLARAGVCSPGSVDELRTAARSLMYALTQRGDASGRHPGEVLVEAALLREAGIEVLDDLDGDEVRLWLDVFRLPSGDVDLVFDLRCIARLFEENAGLLGPDFDPSTSAVNARYAADALERSLWGGRATEDWSAWVARAFALTLTLYFEARRIGQMLRGANGQPLSFPSAAGIARSARRGRGLNSSMPPQRSVPVPPPLPPPARVAEPELTPEPIPDPVPEPATVRKTQTIPPQSSGARRRFDRLSAELEVGLLSDSNFYVGFTEDLSQGGLFVATYFTRPLGSAVELSVRLPGREAALTLRGIVRWVRDDSPTSDGYPGMGIQFDSLSESDQADIAAFLATRAPLFYAD